MLLSYVLLCGSNESFEKTCQRDLAGIQAGGGTYSDYYIHQIDANAPYYGAHEGKKNLEWKDEPDFRPLPLAGK